MPVTPLGIVSPNDPDNYDLVVDLAAMGVSIDTAIQKYGNVQKGTAAQRAAAGTSADNGSLWIDTDGAKMPWRRDSSVTGNWAPAVGRWQGTTAQRNLVTTAPPGMEWFDTTSSLLFRWMGSSWGASSPVSGSVPASSNLTGVTAISFPTGYFSAPPKVIVSLRSYKANAVVGVFTSPTVSGANVNTYHVGTGANINGVAFDWIAMA